MDCLKIPGEKKVVGGTAFDFRVPRVLRTMLPRIPLGGYDLNYCVTQGTEQDLTFHARYVLFPIGKLTAILTDWSVMGVILTV